MLLCISGLIAVSLNYPLTYLSPSESCKVFADFNLIFAVLMST